MLEMLQKVAAILFLAISVYLGVAGVRRTFKYAFQSNVIEKVQGARSSTIYFCLSTIGFFFAIESYKPNLICIPFLALFIGLFWLNYVIYKKTTEYLKE